MRWTTHLVAGMFISTMIGQPLAGVVVAGVVSLLPDIDSHESKIGRKIPLISLPINLIFGHRGVFHSLLALVIVFIVALFFFQTWVVPITVGYLSHLLLDSFTLSKIPWLWPYPERFGFPLVETNSIVDVMLSVFLVLALAAIWRANLIIS
jgi:inner membrane protein